MKLLQKILLALTPGVLLPVSISTPDDVMIAVFHLEAKYPLTVSGVLHNFRTNLLFGLLICGLLTAFSLRVKSKEEGSGWLSAIASIYAVLLFLGGVSAACVADLNRHLQ